MPRRRYGREQILNRDDLANLQKSGLDQTTKTRIIQSVDTWINQSAL